MIYDNIFNNGMYDAQCDTYVAENIKCHQICASSANHE